MNFAQINFTFIPLVDSSPPETECTFESPKSIFLVQLQCSNLNWTSRIFPDVKSCMKKYHSINNTSLTRE